MPAASKTADAANGKDMSSETAAALKAQLEKAEADIAALAKLAGEHGVAKAKEIGARAGETYDDLSEETAALVRQAAERAQDGAAAVDEKARANPWLFIGGAAVVGCLLGAALRR